MKSILSLFLLVGCACPDTHGAPDVRQSFVAERDTACAVVPGCDKDYMSGIGVHVLTVAQVSEFCDEPIAYGCFCHWPLCADTIALTDVSAKGYSLHSLALHEYCHAALLSVGINTHEHPRVFQDCLAAALNQPVGGTAESQR